MQARRTGKRKLQGWRATAGPSRPEPSGVVVIYQCRASICLCVTDDSSSIPPAPSWPRRDLPLVGRDQPFMSCVITFMTDPCRSGEERKESMTNLW
jgi:hypothetical protein